MMCGACGREFGCEWQKCDEKSPEELTYLQQKRSWSLIGIDLVDMSFTGTNKSTTVRKLDRTHSKVSRCGRHGHRVQQHASTTPCSTQVKSRQ
jgi:hypothetical protein